MDQSKIDAILAFYNLLSDKLQAAEQCKKLTDVFYLLHTVVHLISKGTLAYQPHQNFGYKQAVDFLKKEFESEEQFYLHLNPTAADQHNELEIAKILLALLYAFRCSQPEELKIYARELLETHDIELAKLVSYLQDRENWHPRESWPAILKKQSSLFESNKYVTPISRSAKSSVIIPSTPKLMTAESRRQSSFFPMYEPGSPETRSGFPAEGGGVSSPVANVLNSPRGSDVTKLKHQQKQINSMKERLEALGRERESLLDMVLKHENKISLLESENTKLNQKAGKLQKENEMIKSLQEAVTDLQGDNSRLLIELNTFREERDSSLAYHKQLIFERENTIHKLENTKRELEASKKNLENTKRNLQDEMDCHDSLRKKFMELEQQHSNKEAQWQKEKEDMQEELLVKERNLQDKLQRKDEELLAHIELSAQVSISYMEKIGKLKSELETTSNEKDKSQEWVARLQQLEARLTENEAGKKNLLLSLQSSQDHNVKLSAQIQQQDTLILKINKEKEALSNEVAAKEELLEMQSVLLDHLRSNHSHKEDGNMRGANPGLPSTVNWYSAMSGLDCVPSIQSSALSLESAISNESSLCPSDGYQEPESTMLFECQLGTPGTNDRKIRGNRIVEHTPVKTRISTTLASMHSTRRLF